MLISRTLTHFLHHRLSLFLIPLTALLLGGTPAFAIPTLIVNGGQLEGATGVDVGGTLYDVEFLDGTCVTLYMGCDSVDGFHLSNGHSGIGGRPSTIGRSISGYSRRVI